MQLKSLVLQTNRLEELLQFYSNILQLMVARSAAESFEILLPGTSLKFEKAFEENGPIYHFAFNIPCNKIEEARDWLQHRVALLWMEDYESDIADFINWQAKSVYFLDPAGNVVELIARFALNDNVAAAFSSTQIKNVSEIGLVFNENNFEEEVTAFMEKYALTYFDKQPPRPQFRAIGDDEGLFICVPENRAWFPTKNVLSSRLPVEVHWVFNGTFQKIKW